mmetsp:Transcript_127807/g.361772  ORF Transcript_127807/g.361772 Transcript_127807/m.361772 type:complete len:259 (-) Transcript_127807:8-784(-)
MTAAFLRWFWKPMPKSMDLSIIQPKKPPRVVPRARSVDFFRTFPRLLSMTSTTVMAVHVNIGFGQRSMPKALASFTVLTDSSLDMIATNSALSRKPSPSLSPFPYSFTSTAVWSTFSLASTAGPTMSMHTQKMATKLCTEWRTASGSTPLEMIHASARSTRPSRLERTTSTIFRTDLTFPGTSWPAVKFVAAAVTLESTFRDEECLPADSPDVVYVVCSDEMRPGRSAHRQSSSPFFFAASRSVPPDISSTALNPCRA